MQGSVDRIEDNNIAVIVLDDKTVLNIPNTLELQSGDRVRYVKGKIKKIGSIDKSDIIKLQNKVFGKGDDFN